MTKRRSQGEGSIHQEPNGRWVVRIELDRSPSGKRRRLLRRTATKREALETLKSLHQDLDLLNMPQNRTVEATISEYMDSVRLNEGNEAQTQDQDRRWAKRITSSYGTVKVHDLTVQHCDRLLEQIANGTLTGGSGKPVSREYVRRGRAFLANALNNDMRLGYLKGNVALLAVIPATEGNTYVKRALTKAQWLQLFNASTGTTKLAVDLGGRHGLRPQEVRALRWDNLDLDQRTLTILNQFNSKDELVDPKTRNSYRTIRLHDETIELLTERGKELDRLKETNSHRWTERNLVLSTRYGTAINKDNHRRSIHIACAKTDVGRISPYELRHTAITHQVDAGHSVSQIADWAGNSEKMIYEHYRHKIREVVSLDPVDHNNDDA